MKLEYLHDGSPHCPLIRLYDFTRSEAAMLVKAIHSLTTGDNETVAISELPGVIALAGLSLKFKNGNQGHGTSGTFPNFTYELTKDRWMAVESLVEPFSLNDMQACYQWLEDQGEISLLLSPKGLW